MVIQCVSPTANGGWHGMVMLAALLPLVDQDG